MPTLMVDNDLVHHEIAHRIHAARHKGDNFFCKSDEDLANDIEVLFAERGWAVTARPKVQAAP